MSWEEAGGCVDHYRNSCRAVVQIEQRWIERTPDSRHHTSKSHLCPSFLSLSSSDLRKYFPNYITLLARITHSAVQSSTWTLFTLLLMFTHSVVQSFTWTLFTLLTMITHSVVQSSTQVLFRMLFSSQTPRQCLIPQNPCPNWGSHIWWHLLVLVMLCHLEKLPYTSAKSHFDLS